MNKWISYFVKLLCLCCLWIPQVQANDSLEVPVLLYHNFEPSETGSTTISTAKFEAQLQWLKDNSYTVIPLKDLVSYLQGKTNSLPSKSVVITADDGRESVYQHMYPLVKKYKIPVTLFVYPSSISNASYAMTWEQLKELQQSGYFDVQSHTFWHPNFIKDKEKMSADEYQKSVVMQMNKSKEVLDKKLGIQVTLLAWPFGLFNEELEEAASKAGYEMAFTIEPRPASRREKFMAEPRYVISQGQGMQTFEEIAQGKVMKK